MCTRIWCRRPLTGSTSSSVRPSRRAIVRQRVSAASPPRTGSNATFMPPRSSSRIAREQLPSVEGGAPLVVEKVELAPSRGKSEEASLEVVFLAARVERVEAE